MTQPILHFCYCFKSIFSSPFLSLVAQKVWCQCISYKQYKSSIRTAVKVHAFAFTSESKLMEILEDRAKVS